MVYNFASFLNKKRERVASPDERLSKKPRAEEGTTTNQASMFKEGYRKELEEERQAPKDLFGGKKPGATPSSTGDFPQFNFGQCGQPLKRQHTKAPAITQEFVGSGLWSELELEQKAVREAEKTLGAKHQEALDAAALDKEQALGAAALDKEQAVKEAVREAEKTLGAKHQEALDEAAAKHQEALDAAALDKEQALGAAALDKEQAVKEAAREAKEAAAMERIQVPSAARMQLTKNVRALNEELDEVEEGQVVNFLWAACLQPESEFLKLSQVCRETSVNTLLNFCRMGAPTKAANEEPASAKAKKTAKPTAAKTAKQESASAKAKKTAKPTAAKTTKSTAGKTAKAAKKS